MENQKTKGNVFALLPLAVFLILFIGSGIITGDFYAMPTLVAFIIATSVAFIFNKEVDFNTKMEVFCKGGGNKDMTLMLVIFLLAGAFSGVAKAMGGADSVVNLGLSILPPNLLVTGLFIIGCFVSVSMGTSVGTIAAIGSIGVLVSVFTRVRDANDDPGSLNAMCPSVPTPPINRSIPPAAFILSRMPSSAWKKIRVK